MGRKWLWAVSFMLLFCISCKDNRKQVRKDLEELPSQPIELCIEHMQVWKDGWNTDPPHGHKGLKLIIYSDSTVCSSCRLRNIHLWDDWVIKTEAYRDILDICFIFSPTLKDINNFRLAMRTYAPDYPVYVDSLSIFRKANPHLPHNPLFHTFLLDEDNRVVLVGNPLENERIEELFWKIVKERLGERH